MSNKILRNLLSQFWLQIAKLHSAKTTEIPKISKNLFVEICFFPLSFSYCFYGGTAVNKDLKKEDKITEFHIKKHVFIHKTVIQFRYIVA